MQEQSKSDSAQFQQTINKSITVEISQEELKVLKNAGFKLCFAKSERGENFNIVWRSFNNYLQSNTFSWIPKYQVFYAQDYECNARVMINSSSVDVHTGEVIEITPAGIFTPPHEGGPSEGILVKNEFHPVHIGLNQFSTGLDGQTLCMPNYLSPNPTIVGETILTPTENVLVWFEQDIKTSTIFCSPRINDIVLDMTNRNHVNISFANGRWSIIT